MPPILPVIEVAILAIASIPALRVATKRPVLRDLRTYLPWSAVIVTAGLVVFGLAVAAAVRWPPVLHVLTGLALVGALGAWLRARPTYGTRRGWPPGSLGVGQSFDAITRRDYYLEQSRRHGPVFKTSQFGRPVVCLVGLDLARDVLRSDRLAGAQLPYNRLLPRGSLRYMDPGTHDAEAPFFRSVLSDVDLGLHEPRAREACRSALAKLSSASLESPVGAAPGEEVRAWVFTALASIFWDLEPTDPRLAALDRAQTKLRLSRGGGPRWRRAILHHLEEINEIARDRAREWSAGGPPASANALAGALAADPGALDKPVRASNLALVFRLANGDVTSFMRWLLAQVADHPEWQQRVREDDGSDIAGRMVQETLRLEQSEYLYREVVRPLEVGDFRVPAGWLLRVCVQESHRDPRFFPDPDRFDPDRFAGHPRSRREYSPFGVDEHGCMGVSMVHFLGGIFVEELCRGYETRVVRDAPPERGSRHRDHWQPGAARRVRLTPIPQAGQ
ncbi:MAG: cytochrome P450 [Gemmatimonadota bacterium]|nr:cytochrome P450 [Gemmatimonadota bacterium]